MSVMRNTAEEEREQQLHEWGFSRFTPAYFELTEEQRGWLAVNGTDPSRDIYEVLDRLPGENLLPYCRAYQAELGEVASAADAHDCASALADFFYADIQEVTAREFGKFRIPPAELDPKLREMLLILGREADLEFYEVESA